MRNSKILKVAICSALVASVAATAAISASAAVALPSTNVGITGAFTDWAVGSDIPMTDADGDGVYEGVVDLESVKADWIKEWNKDDVSTGESHIQFKVRLDNDWATNWGNYEPEHDRVFDSQCNLAIMEDVKEGDHIKFTVFLDTNKNNPDAVAAYVPEEAGVSADDVQIEFLWAGYKDFQIVKDEAPAAETPATTPATTETTPATGDTTSAIALVAVVLASLGTAVVMTKKASVKD